MTIHAVPKTLDSIKKSLVALKIARAQEVLGATLRQVEQGESEDLWTSLIGRANMTMQRTRST